MFDFNELATILYVLLDAVCFLIIIMMGTAIVVYFRLMGRTLNRLFYLVAACYCLYLGSDAWWAVAEFYGNTHRNLFFLLTGLYFISLSVAAEGWMIYVGQCLDVAWVRNKFNLILLSLPVAIVVALAVTAVSNGRLFDLNDQMKYIRGPMFVIFPVVCYGYFLCSSVMAMSADVRGNTEKKYLAIVLGVYSLPILILGVVHLVAPFNFMSIGYLLSNLILFIYEIVSMSLAYKREREHAAQMQELSLEQSTVISALSEEFECVLQFSLTTEKIKVYRLEGEFAVYPPVAGSYEADVERFARHCVTEDCRESFLDMTRPEKILVELHRQGYYSVVYRLATGVGGAQWYESRYVWHEGQAGKDSIVLGIRNIDREIRTQEQLRWKTELNGKLQQLVDEQTAELRFKNQELFQANQDIIELLGDVVEMRDSDTGQHLIKVKAYSRILAGTVKKLLPEYGLTDADVELIAGASVLHDVGKIVIPDAILLKPGKLTPEEFEIMKTHCVQGCRVLKRIPKRWNNDFMKMCNEICMYHHEKWDGRGYPSGLAGDAIPISAQIVAVADCYDALTAKRVYKAPCPPSVAFEMICSGKCGVFSPKLLDCLRSCRKDIEACSADVERYMRMVSGQIANEETAK